MPFFLIEGVLEALVILAVGVFVLRRLADRLRARFLADMATLGRLVDDGPHRLLLVDPAGVVRQAVGAASEPFVFGGGLELMAVPRDQWAMTRALELARREGSASVGFAPARGPQTLMTADLRLLDDGDVAVFLKDASLEAAWREGVGAELDATAARLARARSDVGPILVAAARGVKAEADAAGVELRAGVSPRTLTTVGDPRPLERACGELLLAAIRLSARGGQVGAAARAAGQDLELILAIAPGVGEETLASSSSAASVRRLAASLGASLAVEAKAGVATVIRLTLAGGAG